MVRRAKKTMVVIGVIVLLAGTQSLAASWQDEYEPDDDTLGLWHFNEDSGHIAHDVSGQGNHAQIVRAFWEEGFFGSSLRFSDRSYAGRIPQSFDDAVEDQLTVEAWILWNGPHPWTPSSTSIIFDARSLGSYRGGFSFYLGSNGVVIFRSFYGQHETQLVTSGEVSINEGEWTHVAAVLDHRKGELRMHVNGRLVGREKTGNPYVDFRGYAATIGNNRWAPGDGWWAPFNGKIDELRVSNVARFYEATVPMATFDVETASLRFGEDPGGDTFTVSSHYELAPQSDGIEPENEEVIVQVGSYMEVIPAGSFSCAGGMCRYAGAGPGITNVMITGDAIACEARAVDLSGTANPVAVEMQIGDDAGQSLDRLAGDLSMGDGLVWSPPPGR